MADADLQIVFDADASGVARGAADARAALAQIGPAVDDASRSFAAFKQAIEAAFKPPATQSVKAAAAEVAAIARTAESERIAQINTDLSVQKQALQEQISNARAAYSQGETSRQAEHDTVVRLINQEAAAEVEGARQTLAARLAADETLKSAYASGSIEYLHALDDEAKAWQTFLDAKVKADAGANSQIDKQRATELASFKRDWDSAVNPVVNSFTSGIEGMIDRTKTFRQAMLSLGEQILTDFVTRLINPMIERWLWKEAGQTVATMTGVTARTSAETVGATQSMAIGGATAVKSVINDAAKTFSGAYSALVGIPIIGPVIAPPAATAASGAVLAVQGTIASASGGYDIPPGLNPIAQLHQQEMVLPATLANPMRAMLGGYAGAKAPAAGDAGANHVHLNISAIDASGVQQFFDTHGDKLFKTLNGKLRAGAKLAVG